jgi:hypothetical protein
MGGFTTMNGIKSSNNLIDSLLCLQDISGAVQIKFDLSKINKKIGLFKNKTHILNSTYDEISNEFPINSIKILPQELLNDLSLYSIVTIGKLDRIYNDFMELMNTFFSYKPGFDIKINPSYVDFNGGIFNNKTLYDILKTSNGLYGTIIINNINDILKIRGKVPIEYGFIDNDLIYIPYGLTIILFLDIDMEELGVNSIGKQYIANLKKKSDYDNGESSIQTIISPKKIMRIIKVPLILDLEQFVIPEQEIIVQNNIKEDIPLFQNVFKSDPPISINVKKGTSTYNMVSKSVNSNDLKKYYKKN